MTRPVRPEDVLPAGVDAREMAGVPVRKGSVAAFVANARLLAELDPTTRDHAAVAAQLRALVPTLRAVGVFEVFELRSPALAAIVAGA